MWVYYRRKKSAKTDGERIQARLLCLHKHSFCLIDKKFGYNEAVR